MYKYINNKYNYKLTFIFLVLFIIFLIGLKFFDEFNTGLTAHKKHRRLLIKLHEPINETVIINLKIYNKD